MTEAGLNVVSVHTLLPPVRHENGAVEDAFMRWVGGQGPDVRTKARRILRNAGVDGRHSFLTLEEIFTPCSLTDSMTRYRRSAVELGTEVLREGLEKAEVEPDEVDVLLTTSCTGYMIPSVDAHMAERLGMRSDLLRLPVTEMGCAAGASALIYAAKMLRGQPGGIAAIVNVEFPTNTIQLGDFSFDNIVATALFSDGLGCTVLRQGGPRGLASVADCLTHRVLDTTHVLGYQLTDRGFRMDLDQSVPEVIAEHFHRATAGLLARNGLTLRDIEHFVIHPGGVKILDRIQELLDPHGGDVSRSREVMRRCGNMSSSTVTFILESLLASRPSPGPALMMSFGPGFEAHQVLLAIHEGGDP
jgi:predicted naringenin-chalcone synthase